MTVVARRQSAAAEPAGRTGRFELAFHRVGATTRLGRRFVSYPFHMTRPFALDPALPELATVYQQSASGGLYRDDRMGTVLEIGPRAALHLTTQSATVVHDARGRPARLAAAVSVAADGFLAMTPDPLVLFPGAMVETATRVDLAEGAVACLSEAFAVHDPSGRGAAFERLAAATTVHDAAGRLRFADRFALAGDDFAGPGGVVGGRRLVAGHLLLGPARRLPGRADLVAATAGEGVDAGLLVLPNDAGWAVRLLAATAVAERRAAEAVFRLAVRAALGADPAPRRK